MGKKVARDLDDEDILRIARLSVTESAAGTYTQTSIDTQLSIERGVIWMIHFIEFSYSQVALLTEVAPASIESITAQITRESKDAIQSFTAADTVQAQSHVVSRSAAIGTDSGPLWLHDVTPKRFDYAVPMVYAGQNIFFGIKGSDASLTHTVEARIGYSIRTVSDKFFFRVAQALVS